MGINVGISGVVLKKNRRGFEVYLRQLMESLSRIDNDFHIYLYTDKEVEDICFGSKISNRVISRKLNGFFWRNVQLPFHVIRDKIDVFHFPDNSVWLVPVVPTVVTLHDISPVLCSAHNLVSGWMLVLIKFIYFCIKVNSRFIITDSKTSKKDIDRYFGFTNSKVIAVPLAYDRSFTHVVKRDGIEQFEQFEQDKGYVLYVGGIDRRKNIAKLVKAVDVIQNLHKRDIKLVIVGEYKKIKGIPYLTEDDIIRDTGMDKFVVLKGYISETELVELYNNASVFVLPSFYEGFGITVLEAMACGVPVIVSDMDWGHEITGGNSLFIDPENENDIADKIYSILADKELSAKLRKAGLEHAKKFSWINTAQKTLEIYKKAAGKRCAE